MTRSICTELESFKRWFRGCKISLVCYTTVLLGVARELPLKKEIRNQQILVG